MKNNLILGIIIGVLLSFSLDIVAENIISSNAISYLNSKTNETTVNGALDELFSAIDINKRLGDTNISTIGGGTVTGAISSLNNSISNLNSNKLDKFIIKEYTLPTVANTLKQFTLPSGVNSNTHEIVILETTTKDGHTYAGNGFGVDVYDFNNFFINTTLESGNSVFLGGKIVLGFIKK